MLAFLPPRFLPWWLTGNRGTNLSEEIIRQGWAFVYEPESGVFPHPDKRDRYLKLMNEAQYVAISVFMLVAHDVLLTRNRDVKVGIWKNGTSLETPGQYKKRTKREGGVPDITDDVMEASEEEGSWFRLKLKNVFRRP